MFEEHLEKLRQKKLDLYQEIRQNIIDEGEKGDNSGSVGSNSRFDKT